MFMQVLSTICNDYIKYYDRIYNLKTGEVQQLAEDLIKFCSERKWETSSVLLLISIAAECNLIYLREYWELFKQIYNHFKLRPPAKKLQPYIAALFSKEYNIAFNIETIPDYLDNYKNMEMEEILRVYDPSSKMYCILHDDIKEFAVLMGPIIDKETFSAERFEDKTLIEWCCYYGALRCFRYLRAQDVEITEECLAYSFIGKNTDIIHECSVEIGDTLRKTNIMDICIKINDEDYLVALHNYYKQSWRLSDAARAMNLKAFYMLASITNRLQMILDCWCYFGITEQFDVIYDGSIKFDKQYMLNLAASNNSVEFISKFVALGADVNAKDRDENFALYYAATNNNVDAVSKLIELGANIELENGNQNTPLITAAYDNCADTVSKLISSGANIEAKNSKGFSPLYVASTFTHSVESLQLLLDAGANVDSRDYTDIPALTIAASEGNLDAVLLLIKYGASIETTDYNGNTVLIAAAEYDNVDLISKMIELGANIEAKNNKGATPLIKAAEENRVNAISKLIELGANIEAKDNDGNTALIKAAEQKNIEAISKLIELGANIEAKDNDGNTALIKAADLKHDDISTLMKPTANTEAKDDFNTKLLEESLTNNVNCISKLVELGANIEAKDNAGNTALMKASIKNTAECVSKLIELGAK